MKLTGKIAHGALKDFADVHYSAAHHRVPRVWMVVADSYSAQIFRRDGEQLELLGEAFRSDTHGDLGNDTIGRTPASGGGTARHKYEPHFGASHEREIRFSQQLAGWLDKVAAEDVFDRLVLVAAPHMLGDLRKVMGEELQDKIIAEVNKEMVGHPLKDLQRELARVL